MILRQLMSSTAVYSRCLRGRVGASHAPFRSRLPRIHTAPSHPSCNPAGLARCFATTAISRPSTRPADTRVDINLNANRTPIDALSAAYLQSPSLHTLTPLLATLTIHEHLYQLSNHLRAKLSAASATASLFFSAPANTTAAVTASATEPANSSRATAAISFEAVSVQQLDDELLSERIVKAFHIHPTTTPTATRAATANVAGSLPIIVESDWRTERNKIRGMGIHSYSMRVLVHVPLPLTADFPSSLSSAASLLLSPQYASFVLTDSHDAGLVMRDVELVGVLPVLMGMGGLSEAEWVWLMSMLCTHPSDVAFDVMSAALASGDRD